MTKKTIYSIAFAASMIFASVAPAIAGHKALPNSYGEQRRDIESLIREIDYLIEVSKQLQKHYGGDKSRIRFNYSALITQLLEARNGAMEYLDMDVTELHAAPPIPVKRSTVIIEP